MASMECSRDRQGKAHKTTQARSSKHFCAMQQKVLDMAFSAPILRIMLQRTNSGGDAKPT
jgi:hypothetical protein